jgi:hypothetical protein
MHRRFVLVALATFCLAPSLRAALPAATDDLYEGKIAASGAKAITVLAKNGDNLEFMIAADCKITIDGEPSTADKLAVGLTVKITAAKAGEARVAKRIDAASAN